MMTSYFNLLKYAATGIASPDMTYYDRMRASTLMGGVVQTLTGIPPLTFKADGTPLISWSMKGNGSQSGTPTPDNPVMPEFVGAKTSNLFDKDNTTVYKAYMNVQNNGWMPADDSRSIKIPCKPNETYTISTSIVLPIFRVAESQMENAQPTLEWDTITLLFVGTNTNECTITTSASAKWLIFQGNASLVNTWMSELMLNLGSTAMDYEPYGYKIGISCAGQTTPVYLGQVSTVRKIKKLILTGTETGWTENSSGTNTLRAVLQLSDANENGTSGYCSHTKFVMSGVSRDEELAGTLNGNLYLRIRKTIAPDIAAFKQWLADEYANGEPVCVWYVLATEQTEITNEPLCKIGTYADELSSEDAGVTIPTVKGSNVLTVDTPIQPSEMTITYKG